MKEQMDKQDKQLKALSAATKEAMDELEAKRTKNTNYIKEFFEWANLVRKKLSKHLNQEKTMNKVNQMRNYLKYLLIENDAQIEIIGQGESLVQEEADFSFERNGKHYFVTITDVSHRKPS